MEATLILCPNKLSIIVDDDSSTVLRICLFLLVVLVFVAGCTSSERRFQPRFMVKSGASDERELAQPAILSSVVGDVQDHHHHLGVRIVG